MTTTRAAAADGGEALAAAAPKVVGIDLSMTSTGVACNLGWTERLQSKGSRTDPIALRSWRLQTLAEDVADLAKNADLVVLEGPAYAASSAGAWDRGGLWWMVVSTIVRRDTPLAIAPPMSRAKYATGSGGASKDRVLAAAVKRFTGFDITGNDIADAVVLAAMGADWLGHPITDMPANHRGALDGVAWPDLKTEAAS